jgi:hypothetical protein
MVDEGADGIQPVFHSGKMCGQGYLAAKKYTTNRLAK